MLDLVSGTKKFIYLPELSSVYLIILVLLGFQEVFHILTGSSGLRIFLEKAKWVPVNGNAKRIKEY